MARESDRRTTLARLPAGADAQRIADLLAESLDAAVAACETKDGWAVELLFAAEPDEAKVRALLATVAGDAAARAVTFEPVPAKDWVAATLADLAPVTAGRFVVHGAHHRTRVPANSIGIEIEAGLAFGTGHHGTTRGCLLALSDMVRRRPRHVLDLGTGSGVLAIAAAKALRTRVLASDIDRQAVHTARANARQNGLAPLVECLHAAGLTAPRLAAAAPFDLVLANILLGPLTRLARPLTRLLSPGAHVVLSGLLRAQEPAALAAYRPNGLVLERRIALDEWVTLVLRAEIGIGGRLATPPLPHHRTYGSVSGGSVDYANCGVATEAKPSERKKRVGRAMASAGLLLSRHGPCGLPAVWAARSRPTPRRRSSA